ncbi:hypothetical protein D3C85_1508600 [compost metagenome]
MPCHGLQSTVKVGEEVPPFCVIDEAAEEGLIGRRAKLAGQLGHERHGVGVLLEWMLRVVRNIGDYSCGLGGPARLGAEDDNAGQR